MFTAIDVLRPIFDILKSTIEPLPTEPTMEPLNMLSATVLSVLTEDPKSTLDLLSVLAWNS